MLKNQIEKALYADLEIEISYFEESCIRTSYDNDGNSDEDWGDENAQLGTF